MNGLLLAVNTIFLFALLIKLSWMIQHLFWIGTHGRAYMKALVGAREMRVAMDESAQPPDMLDLLDEVRDQKNRTGNDVAMLGFKEFKARALAHQLGESSRWWRRVLGRAISTAVLLTDLGSFVISGGALLVLTAQLSMEDRPLYELLIVVGTTTSLVFLVVILELTFEACVSYARLRNYATALQNPLAFINAASASSLLTELRFLLLAAGCTVYIDAAALRFLALAGWDFGPIGASLREWSWAGIISDIYHAVQTFILQTEAVPGDWIAKVAVALISVHGVGILVLVISSLGAASGALYTEDDRRNTS